MSFTIVVVGLGPGSPDALTVGALSELMTSGRPTFARTARHPVVSDLANKGVQWITFDHLYERAGDYEQLYREIGRTVVAAAQQHGSAVYAVPGHPSVLESSVSSLLEQASSYGIAVRLVPGLSFIDTALAAVSCGADDGLTVLAADGECWPISGELPLLLAQVTSRRSARSVKLRLLPAYGADHVVHVVSAAGGHDQRVTSVSLAAVDRCDYDHVTAVFVPALPCSRRQTGSLGRFSEALAVVARLRGPEGCPWDREQTPLSLRPYVIEEAYEVVAAVDGGDSGELCQELGDLLLQVLLLTEIASEAGQFSIEDVLAGLSDKLVRRHPHVFGDSAAHTPADVVRQWERIKGEERAEDETMFAHLPASLPALLQAWRVQSKAAQVGFDWDRTDPVFDKVSEELAELGEAYRSGDEDRIREEAGDLLFSVVNLCRSLQVEPEMALKAATAKFISRFEEMDGMARQQGMTLQGMTLAEMDTLWERCKKEACPERTMKHKP